MKTLEQVKAEIQEVIDAREGAVRGEWHLNTYSNFPKGYSISAPKEGCIAERWPLLEEQDLAPTGKFITLAANRTAQIAKNLLACLEFVLDQPCYCPPGTLYPCSRCKLLEKVCG